MQYQVGRYRNERWAVLHGPTGVWYFPSRYGYVSAQSMARRLNTEAT